MIAIDTNVLIRILINEPEAEQQCRLARELIAKHDSIWVCQVVLIETLWVLQATYQFKKEQILLALEKLRNHPDIILESAETLDADLALFDTSNIGFADCVILNDANSRQLVLHTFDRKLARLQGAKRVGDDVE
jgi:predicted nucleic-acid-binding protein